MPKQVKKHSGKPPRRAASKKLTTPAPVTLRLYIAGQTPKSLTAIANLKRICEQHMDGDYHIDVVDLMANPQLAASDQILAIPTLVRKLPEPVRKIIGDLSSTQRVLVALELSEHTGDRNAVREGA